MKKFRSIEGLSKIFAFMRNNADYHNIPYSELPVINFTGTVKIHGTNAGIRISDKDITEVVAQGKDRTLTIQHDNAGFAAYCAGIPKTVLKEIYEAFNSKGNGVLTVFGEWAGANVQNGVAVSELPPHFIIFAAHLDNTYIPINKSYHNHDYRIYNIYEAPTFSVDIDFSNPGNIEEVLTQITLEVERECPWGKLFNISGIGEGVVWHKTDDPTDGTYVFKVKGPKHSVRNNKNGKSATIDVEKVNNVNECVDIILTENRMLQMIKDKNIEIIPENFGEFLKAVNFDCIKEESEVIIKNNLIWKDLSGVVAKRCKEWYFNHFKI